MGESSAVERGLPADAHASALCWVAHAHCGKDCQVFCVHSACQGRVFAGYRLAGFAGRVMTFKALQGSDLKTVSIALIIGGMMWGLYWIPVRFFMGQGLSGPWPGIAMYTSALVVLSPILWRERLALLNGWQGLILSGMFTGAGFCLFTISLVNTDVVRSILLFYLTPVWGTILGMLFLGERLGPTRVLGLLCGLGGMFIVLGGGQIFP